MKTTSRFMVCALFAVSAAFATTTYTQSVSSVTSVTIPGTTHNLGCGRFAVRVYDSNNVRQPASAFTATKDPVTFDATVTFGATFTGTVKLQGCFTATSASTDFQVTDTAGVVTACSTCADAAFAAREYNSQWCVSTEPFSFTSNGDGQSGTMWVYLDPISGHVQFAVSSTSGVGTASSGSQVVYNSTGIPTGAAPLATLSYSSAGFGSVTDSRNFN